MTREPKRTLELHGTGVPAFDTILGGGIPARSVVIVAGEPGSGKTVLTLQMLFHAARQGRKSLYFTTLSEPAPKLIQYMQLFDFFDAELLHDHIQLADLGVCARQGASSVLDAIQARTEAAEPSYVVIDSFRALVDLISGTEDKRAFIYDLSCQTSGWGASSILVGEYTRADVAMRPEFAIADGIVSLGSEREELTAVRGIEVLKMRGMGYATGRHTFEIDPRGISIYQRVSAPADVQLQGGISFEERATTGVAGLDDALGGGLPRRSTTVLQGGTGTGKTLLSLKFLLEGARLGESGAMFTLEESPSQLRNVARSMGWDLEEAERRGLLTLVYTSPVELATDRFLRRASEIVKQGNMRRAVFDSLTTMALGVPSVRRFKELVYSLAKHLRSDEVTLLMTSESEQLLGSANLSGDGVSFIADNLIQLRYVELGGKLERAIAVIKARGIQHASEARRLVIDRRDLRVVPDSFVDLRGVLTGLPRRETEPR